MVFKCSTAAESSKQKIMFLNKYIYEARKTPGLEVKVTATESWRGFQMLYCCGILETKAYVLKYLFLIYSPICKKLR
jgi:hypothetical protein